MIVPREMKLNAFENVEIAKPSKLYEQYGYNRPNNKYTTTEDNFSMPVNTQDNLNPTEVLDTGLNVQTRKLMQEQQRAAEAQKQAEAEAQKQPETPKEEVKE